MVGPLEVITCLVDDLVEFEACSEFLDCFTVLAKDLVKLGSNLFVGNYDAYTCLTLEVFLVNYTIKFELQLPWF